MVSRIMFPLTLSFAISLLLTPLCRNWALLLGWVDHPDFNRKIHRIPIPRVGGVPIVVACWVSFATLLLAGFRFRSTGVLEQAMSVARSIGPASALIFIVGLVDDLIGLKPTQKLAGQSLAALFVCLGGFTFNIFGDGLCGCVLNGLITIIWLLGCTNAFNLIDGIDGLAAGLGLITTLAVLSSAMLIGNAGIGVTAAIMAGALFGFLPFNFNPASIFLGDSGSLWIGFMLGCFGITWSEKAKTVLGLLAPAVALSVPLLDTTLSFARRFVASRPIFRADRGHVHHRLIDRGFTVRRVALSLYGATALASGLSFCLSIGSGLMGTIALLVFGATALFAIQCLRYKEFDAFTYLLRRVRSNVQPLISLHELEEELRKAANPEECWAALCKAGKEFRLTSMTLKLAGSRFEERFTATGNGAWDLHIRFSMSDYVRLTQQRNSATAPDSITRLADLLHSTLSEKSATFLVVRPRNEKTVAPQRNGSPVYQPHILQSGIHS